MDSTQNQDNNRQQPEETDISTSSGVNPEASQDIRAYLNDIKEIKTLLQVNQDTPLVSRWAFFTWSFFIALGTLVHLYAWNRWQIGLYPGLWYIWLPVFLLGGVLESIGFYQEFHRQAPVLTNPAVIRKYLGLWNIFLAGSVLLIFLLQRSMLEPSMILVLQALFFGVYAMVATTKILVPAYLLLALGILFMVVDFQGPWAMGIVGFAGSGSFLLGGLLSRQISKSVEF